MASVPPDSKTFKDELAAKLQGQSLADQMREAAAKPPAAKPNPKSPQGAPAPTPLDSIDRDAEEIERLMQTFNPNRKNVPLRSREDVSRDYLGGAAGKLDALIGQKWRHGPLKSDIYRFFYAAAERGGVTEGHIRAAADAAQRGDARRLKLSVSERRAEKFNQDPAHALGLPFRLVDLVGAVQEGKADVPTKPDPRQASPTMPLQTAIELAESRSGMPFRDFVMRELGPMMNARKVERKAAATREFEAIGAESQPDRELADTSYLQWLGQNVNPFKWLAVGNEAAAEGIGGFAADRAAKEFGTTKEQILADPEFQAQVRQTALMLNVPEQIAMIAIAIANPPVGAALLGANYIPPALTAAGLPFSGPEGRKGGIAELEAFGQSMNPFQDDWLASGMGLLNLLGTGADVRGAVLTARGRRGPGLIERDEFVGQPETVPVDGSALGSASSPTLAPSRDRGQAGGKPAPVSDGSEVVDGAWLKRQMDELLQGDEPGAVKAEPAATPTAEPLIQREPVAREPVAESPSVKSNPDELPPDAPAYTGDLRDLPSDVVVALAPDQITVHPDMQSRRNARGASRLDPENELRGETFLRDQQGEMTVYIDHDGTAYIADGHHRLDLANRAKRFGVRSQGRQITEVPKAVKVTVRNAKDGWTLEEAASEAAMRNMAAGTIDAVDSVHAMRFYGMTVDDIIRDGVALKPNQARNIDGLLGLPEELFDSFVRNGDLSHDVAAGIGSVEGLGRDGYEAALRAADKHGRLKTFADGQQLARDVRRVGVSTDQGGLPGMESIKPLAFAERALVVAALKNKIGREISETLRPVDVRLLEGEQINRESRKALVEKLGGSSTQAKGRLDFALEYDTALDRAVWDAAEQVQDGRLTAAEAASRLAEQAKQSASRGLNEIVNAKRSEQAQSAEGGPEVPGEPSRGIDGDEREGPLDDGGLFVGETRAGYSPTREGPVERIRAALQEDQSIAPREYARGQESIEPSNLKRKFYGVKVPDTPEWDVKMRNAGFMPDPRRVWPRTPGGPKVKVWSAPEEPWSTKALAEFGLRPDKWHSEKISEREWKLNSWNMGSDGKGTVSYTTGLRTPPHRRPAVVEPRPNRPQGVAARALADAEGGEFGGLMVKEDVRKYGQSEIDFEADAAEQRVKAYEPIKGDGEEGVELDPVRIDDLAKIAGRYALQFGEGLDVSAQAMAHLVKAWGATKAEAAAAVRQAGMALSRYKPNTKSGSLWSQAELDGQDSLFGGISPVAMVGAGELEDDEETKRNLMITGLALLAGFAARRGLRRTAWAQRMRQRFGAAVEPYLGKGWGLRHYTAQALLDPRMYAKKMGGRVAFAINSMLEAKGNWHVRVERDQIAVRDAAEKAFGKGWRRSKAVKQSLGELRDKIESGQPLTDQERILVEEVQKIHSKFPEAAWKVGIGVDDVNSGDKGFLLGSEVRAVVKGEDGYNVRKKGVVTRIEEGADIVFEADGEEFRIPQGGKFDRPIHELGTEFVPRILRPEFVAELKKMTDARTAAAESLGSTGEYATFRDALEAVDRMAKARTMAEGGRPVFFQYVDKFEQIAQELLERNPVEFSNIGDAKAWLQEAGDTLADEKDLISFMSSLEKARRIAFAGEHYVKDYLEAFGRYIDRAHKRIAIAESLGNPDPRALDGMLKGVRQADARQGDYLERLLLRFFRLGEARDIDRPEVRRLAAAEGSAQSILKLTGGTTQFAQLSDLVQVLTRVETSAALRGFRDMFSKNKRVDAVVLSGAHRDIMGDLLSEDARGGLQKAADIVHTVTLIKGLDTTVKTTAMAIGLQDVRGLLRRAKKKGLSAADKRRAERYGLDEKDLAAGEALLDDERALNRVAERIRGDLTYSGAAEHNPLWMASGPGAVFMRLKKPVYYVTKFLIRDVLNEATHGNFKPLTKLLLYGTAVGTGVKEWRNWLDGNDEPDLGAEIEADTPFSRKFILWASEALDRVAQAGALGLARDMTKPYNFDITGRFDVLSAAAPTSVSDFRSWLGFASELEFTQPFREIAGLKDAQESDEDDFWRELGRSVPLVRRVRKHLPEPE